MKQETIFKVGDKVFDYLHGWGIVEDYEEDDVFFPINVSFKKTIQSYMSDGRLHSFQNPTLSFTEYTLEGFSQERKDTLPNKGDIVWVRDYKEEDWMMATFLSIDTNHNKYRCTFYNPNDSSKSLLWRYLTTQNPYK